MRDHRAYVRGLYYRTAVGHVLLLQLLLQKALVVRLARRPAILPPCQLLNMCFQQHSSCLSILQHRTCMHIATRCANAC